MTRCRDDNCGITPAQRGTNETAQRLEEKGIVSVKLYRVAVLVKVTPTGRRGLGDTDGTRCLGRAHRDLLGKQQIIVPAGCWGINTGKTVRRLKWATNRPSNQQTRARDRCSLNLF